MQLSNSSPLFDLKTPVSGWPYIPTESAGYLRIEKLYPTDSLAGDITGYPYLVGPSLIEIPNIPDGTVNMKDQAIICRKFGLSEGQSGWDYMADLKPDGVINMKDIGTYARTFGNSGTYISSYLNGIMGSSVTVTFYIGGLYRWATVPPDALGFVPIPYQTATNFTVKLNGNPVSALVTLWTP